MNSGVLVFKCIICSKRYGCSRGSKGGMVACNSCPDHSRCKAEKWNKGETDMTGLCLGKCRTKTKEIRDKLGMNDGHETSGKRKHR